MSVRRRRSRWLVTGAPLLATPVCTVCGARVYLIFWPAEQFLCLALTGVLLVDLELVRGKKKKFAAPSQMWFCQGWEEILRRGRDHSNDVRRGGKAEGVCFRIEGSPE